MPLIVKDRVREARVTSGTGTVTLTGSPQAFQTFSSAIGNGNTTYYTITEQGTGNFEVGIGTVGVGTLARTTVLESSNAGALVNFGSATKDVFCTYPAEKSVDIDTPQTLTNKSFSSSIAINGSTSGSINLQSPAVAGTTTLTLPARSGTVMVNGPAFSASLGSGQNISNATFNKITCNTEEFDTNNAYDNATNYRFTPQVAGYYQVSGEVQYGALITNNLVVIYKNGVEHRRGTQTGAFGVNVSALVYLNGTTDYIELFCFQLSGVTQPLLAGASNTYFQAVMVRGA
jgi:hypothetical protein